MANEKESRLKFVAQFENGKASVGLQFIPKDHPYNLEGKRQYRIVLYGPLCRSTSIDKGAGAGAEVTASEFLLM
jgi:aspartokinase/homoserine dehydrogenase 1